MYKRKSEIQEKVHKSIPVEIIIEDVTSHPLCLHGPTLLFTNHLVRYYSCSCCRNKKDCSVYIEEDDWKKESIRKRNEKYYNLIPNLNKIGAWEKLIELKSFPASHRAYCDSCHELYVTTQDKKHSMKNHRIISALSDDQLNNPSAWLPTLENDSIEAQYTFTKKTISVIFGILRNNNIRNVICIGTPSVHEAAQEYSDFKSILLDYDQRHHLFHQPSKFLWYNMFNNYLFNGNEDEQHFQKFLKQSRDSGVCIVMDPPFGGRVEPLVDTLRQVSSRYRLVTQDHSSDQKLIPVIWAFPYFSEPYIQNIIPEMKMHDYQVEYENHKKFHNNSNKGRKFGSPVRFFTNLPFATIDLSNDSNYMFCERCEYWVSKSNRHCSECLACTSKNGMTYRHCNACRRCVKPTFLHCNECGRCCQAKAHVCGTVVQSQSCYNCKEKGHKQAECPQLQRQNGVKKKKLKQG